MQDFYRTFSFRRVGNPPPRLKNQLPPSSLFTSLFKILDFFSKCSLLLWWLNPPWMCGCWVWGVLGVGGGCRPVYLRVRGCVWKSDIIVLDKSHHDIGHFIICSGIKYMYTDLNKCLPFRWPHHVTPCMGKPSANHLQSEQWMCCTDSVTAAMVVHSATCPIIRASLPNHVYLCMCFHSIVTCYNAGSSVNYFIVRCLLLCMCSESIRLQY